MAKSKNNRYARWSEDEVKLLKKLFPKGKAREVADRTGRPLTAVRQKAYDMGLRTRECRLWTTDEIELLKKRFPKENLQSIADILGQSSGTVRQKACQIGFRKSNPSPACLFVQFGNIFFPNLIFSFNYCKLLSYSGRSFCFGIMKYKQFF